VARKGQLCLVYRQLAGMMALLAKRTIVIISPTTLIPVMVLIH
jgi:hypothetical protein